MNKGDRCALPEASCNRRDTCEHGWIGVVDANICPYSQYDKLLRDAMCTCCPGSNLCHHTGEYNYRCPDPVRLPDCAPLANGLVPIRDASGRVVGTKLQIGTTKDGQRLFATGTGKHYYPPLKQTTGGPNEFINALKRFV